ncbi:MAG: phosphoenolpyruvate synthase [bacterium]|nr:phosphoenolpyruvate synthase [bacterium]
MKYIAWFETLRREDVATVGGKNSSLGEMIHHLTSKGIRVPNGFATTSDAFREYIEFNQLMEPLRAKFAELDRDPKSLARVGRAIRGLVLNAGFPPAIAGEIREAYRKLSLSYEMEEADVAVRSSATAEDLPDASFAGQQETILNVVGEEELLVASRQCFASLFTDRAIVYRQSQGFDHLDVALSIGVQKMVRSDLAGSGVIFSIDTESGFRDAAVITAAWGIGENVVQGAVTPDEYRVFKPLLGKGAARPIIQKDLGSKEYKMVYARGASQTIKNMECTRAEKNSFVLSDDEILQMAEWTVTIENHYGCPMDIEWAKDGQSEELYVVQARPETVQSRRAEDHFKSYSIKARDAMALLEGIAIGDAVATGHAKVIRSARDIDQFEDGCILVTEITDPDWVPVMKRASAIVTDQGGRTSHAAIVSRELGIPALVGAKNATHLLQDGQRLTVSCAEGNVGYVYDGILEYEEEDIRLDDLPETKTTIKLNIASPAAAMRWWRLPTKGVGLARMEFIINNLIKIHPMALINWPHLEDREAIATIAELTDGYPDKSEYFVDRLALGIAQIAAVQHPHSVLVRMSDFKTNEYADLIGGRQFEPGEENPMLGFRGASRYYSDEYREGFALECRAIRRVREEIGLDNVWIMIPFCRTLDEADRVHAELEQHGLKRGENGLKVYVMCELPSNVFLADQFAERFDGFSIGSNDLTQLTLGVDRDSSKLSYLFDERNAAVKAAIQMVIKTAHAKGCEVGICGQGPSDFPDFAEFLVEAGIDSMSLNPDSVIEVLGRIAKLEQARS